MDCNKELMKNNFGSSDGRKRKKDDLEWQHDAEDFGEQCGVVYILSLSGSFVYSCRFCEENFKNSDKFLEHIFQSHSFQDTRSKFQSDRQRSVAVPATTQIRKAANNDQQTGRHSKFVDNIVNPKAILPTNLKREHSTQSQHKYELDKPIINSAKSDILIEQNNNDFHHKCGKYAKTVHKNIDNASISLLKNNNTASYLQNTNFKSTSSFNYCIQSDDTSFADNVLVNNFYEIVTEPPPNNSFLETTSSGIIDNVNDESSEQQAIPMSGIEESNEIIESNSQQFDEQQTSGPTYILQDTHMLGENGVSFYENHINSQAATETTNLVAPIVDGAGDDNNSSSCPQPQFADAIITQQQNEEQLTDSIQQNFIFDGTHLQPANFVDENGESTPNFFIKFSPDDGNIYLVNTIGSETLTNDLTSFQGILQHNIVHNPILEGVAVDNLIDNTYGGDSMNTNIICNSNNTLLENLANQQIQSNNQFNCFSDLVTTSDCVSSNDISQFESIAESNICENELVSQTDTNTEENYYSSNKNNIQNTTTTTTTTTTNLNNAETAATTKTPDLSNKGGKQSSYLKPNFLENFQKFLENKTKNKRDEESDSASPNQSPITIRKLKDSHDFIVEETDDFEEVLSQAASDSMKRNPTKLTENDNNTNDDTLFKSQGKVQKKDAYHCNYCEKDFSIKMAYEDHVRIHTGEKPFVCDLCPQAFRCKKYLDTHITRHFGKQPFSCHFCDRNFATATERNNHECEHTSVVGVRYRCNPCNEEFPTRPKYSMHLREHGPIKYKCEQCPQIFNSELTLKEHQKAHTILHNNHHQGNDVQNYDNTNHHDNSNTMRKIQISSESYVCQFCEAEFPSNRTLQNHIDIIHSNEKSYICVACQTEFVDQNQYTEHLKMHKQNMADHQNHDNIIDGDDKIDVLL